MTNKPKIIVDHFSTSTVPIEMFFGDTSLSTASAFLYEFEHQTYLVTNWHNLSGRSPESGEPVSPTCGLPDRISFALPTVENVAAWKIVSTHLFEQFNDSRVARWYEHPDSGSTVDIGVLPLDAIPGLKLNAINNFIQNKQLPITVAAEVFVLGYPKRLNSGGAFPIWKRASIA
ncbi:MAG: hypothetical protein KDH09_04590, partial [Chrysiogenetes bacterium]|nr:hypothetical protein [Chrysiogenetes bacterium]